MREKLITNLGNELGKSIYKQLVINEKYTQFNFTDQEYQALLLITFTKVSQLVADSVQSKDGEIAK